MTTRRGFTRKTVEDKIKRDPEYAKRFKRVVSEGVGKALRDARTVAGLSQKDVAERMGVTESRVTQLEKTSGNSITLRSLRRFASAVGYRLDISLVDPATSQTVSKLFIVDDFATEPIQIEAEARSEAPTASEVEIRQYAIAARTRRINRRDTAASLFVATFGTGSQEVTVVESGLQVWPPRSSSEKYAVAGV